MRRSTIAFFGAALVVVFVLMRSFASDAPARRAPPSVAAALVEDELASFRVSKSGWMYADAPLYGRSRKLQSRADDQSEVRPLRSVHLSQHAIRVLNPDGPGRMLPFQRACFTVRTLALMSQAQTASADGRMHERWVAWRKAYDEALSKVSDADNIDLNTGEQLVINGEFTDSPTIDADDYVWIDESAAGVGDDAPNIERVSQTVLDTAVHLTRAHGSAAYFVLARHLSNLMAAHEHFFAVTNAKLALTRERKDSASRTQDFQLHGSLFDELDTIVAVDAVADPGLAEVFPALKLFASPANLVIVSTKDMSPDDVICASEGALVTKIEFTQVPEGSAERTREREGGDFAAMRVAAARAAVVESTVRQVLGILRAHMLGALDRLRTSQGRRKPAKLEALRVPHVAVLKNARSPKLGNANALAARLLNETFAVRLVQTQNTTFHDLADLLRRSHVLVGVHGPDLAASLYMNPGTAVVQLCPYGMVRACNSIYGRVAHFMGLRYQLVNSRLSEVKWPDATMSAQAREMAQKGNMPFLVQQDIVANLTATLAAVDAAIAP